MNKKIIISVLLFITSAIVSCYCAHYVKNRNAREQISEYDEVRKNAEELSSYSEGSSEGAEKNNSDDKKDIIIPDTTSKIGKDPIVPPTPSIKLKALKVRETNDGEFSFEASYEGEVTVSCHFELWDVGKKVCVARNNDGRFSKIPASATGTYKLALIYDKTGKPVCEAIIVRGFKSKSYDIGRDDTVVDKGQKKLITEEDLQRKIIQLKDHSLDGGKKSVLAPSFRVITRNYKTDDELNLPTDIQDIKDQIIYKRWKSVKLTNVEYNSIGQVTSITIEPIY